MLGASVMGRQVQSTPCLHSIAHTPFLYIGFQKLSVTQTRWSSCTKRGKTNSHPATDPTSESRITVSQVDPFTRARYVSPHPRSNPNVPGPSCVAPQTHSVSPASVSLPLLWCELHVGFHQHREGTARHHLPPVLPRGLPLDVRGILWVFTRFPSMHNSQWKSVEVQRVNRWLLGDES